MANTVQSLAQEIAAVLALFSRASQTPGLLGLISCADGFLGFESLLADIVGDVW